MHAFWSTCKKLYECTFRNLSKVESRETEQIVWFWYFFLVSLFQKPLKISFSPNWIVFQVYVIFLKHQVSLKRFYKKCVCQHVPTLNHMTYLSILQSQRFLKTITLKKTAECLQTNVISKIINATCDLRKRVNRCIYFFK